MCSLQKPRGLECVALYILGCFSAFWMFSVFQDCELGLSRFHVCFGSVWMFWVCFSILYSVAVSLLFVFVACASWSRTHKGRLY